MQPFVYRGVVRNTPLVLIYMCSRPPYRNNLHCKMYVLHVEPLEQPNKKANLNEKATPSRIVLVLRSWNWNEPAENFLQPSKHKV